MLPQWLPAWLRILRFAAVGWVLLAAVRTALRVAAIPRPIDDVFALFGRILLITLPWLFLAPFVVMIATLLPWRTGSRVRTVGVHLTLAAGISLVDSVWGWIALPATGDPVTLSPGLWYLLRMDQQIFTYLCLVGIGIAVRHRRRLDQALLRTARLEAQLMQARLHVLTLQLHPHFLFNTLNAVSELVHRQPARARGMLDSFRELLVRSLDDSSAQELPLRDELALLEPYARIQRTRFAGSLVIQVVPGPDTLNALVPRLVLQPLVENAIRHGTSRRAGLGRVAVRSRSENGKLVIEVEDDGVGFLAGERRDGVGLGNTRARLAQLYGEDARIRLEPAPAGGTLARLECPLRTGPSSVSGEAEVVDSLQPDDPGGDNGVSRARLALGFVAAWLVIAAAGAQEDFLAAHLSGTPARFATVLGPRLAMAALWLGLSPGVLWVANRLATSGVRWPALIASHLIVGLGTIAVHLALVTRLVNPAMDGILVATVLVNDIGVYAALAAVVHAWTVRGIAAGRRAAAAALDAELAATRLELLRWRLRPDLLFGALQRIGELATEQPERADDLTGRLGELLRLMLQSAGAELVPLAHELQLVSAYLAVTGAVRSESTALEVALEADAHSVQVPAMLLQPTVEALGSTRVRISGSLRSGALELVVRGRPAARESQEDQVADLHHRLQSIYGGMHRFAVHRAGEEAWVTIQLPVPPGAPAKAVA